VTPPLASALTASGFEVAFPLSNYGTDTFVSLVRTANGFKQRIVVKVR
jgi:hypothetical protein